jgi:hypothetical protein
METAIIPKTNADEFAELDADVKAAIKVELVENAAEAFYHLFGDAILAAASKKRKPSRAKAETPAS